MEGVSRVPLGLTLVVALHDEVGEGVHVPDSLLERVGDTVAEFETVIVTEAVGSSVDETVVVGSIEKLTVPLLLTVALTLFVKEPVGEIVTLPVPEFVCDTVLETVVDTVAALEGEEETLTVPDTVAVTDTVVVREEEGDTEADRLPVTDTELEKVGVVLTLGAAGEMLMV